MTIVLFRRDNRQVIAVIGEESVVDNDYMLLQCDKAEPTYQVKDGKIYVDLENVIIEQKESEDGK